MIKKVYQNKILNPFGFNEKEWWGLICTFLGQDVVYIYIESTSY